MLLKVQSLLLVGLAQSNIWVEVLLRRVLLDEYLQEVSDGVHVLKAARRPNLDKCFESSKAFSTEIGPRLLAGFNEMTAEEIQSCCSFIKPRSSGSELDGGGVQPKKTANYEEVLARHTHLTKMVEKMKYEERRNDRLDRQSGAGNMAESP